MSQIFKNTGFDLHNLSRAVFQDFGNENAQSRLKSIPKTMNFFVVVVVLGINTALDKLWRSKPTFLKIHDTLMNTPLPCTPPPS